MEVQFKSLLFSIKSGFLLKHFTTAVIVLFFFGHAACQSVIFTNNISRSEVITHKTLHRIGPDFKKFEENPNDWESVDVANFRLSPDDQHWIFGVLANPDSTDRTLKIYLNNVQAGYAKLYQVIGSKIDSTKITGCLLNVNDRATLDRTLSLPVVIPAGEKVQIYLNVWRREFPITLTIALNDPAQGLQDAWTDTILLLVIGFVLLILLTSLVLVLYLPYRENYWFLFYIFFGAAYVLASSGYGSLYLWSAWPWLEENAAIFFGAMSITGFFQFSRKVLKIKETTLLFDWFLVIFSIVYPFISALGFALYFDWWKPGFYAGLLALIYLGLLFCLVIILGLALKKAISEKLREYWWFVSIFLFHFIFVGITVALEAGWLLYSHKLHALMVAFVVPFQMFLMMAFIATRFYKILRERLKLLQENEAIALEKEDQNRYYGNILHEIIKGEAQSILVEVNENGSTKDQLAELVTTCELGISIIDPNSSSLYDLLMRMEFFFSSRLHSETKERYFYCEVKDELKKFPLTYLQKYELTFFLRESLNNIRKYSHYNYAALRAYHANDPIHTSGVILEIEDDGVGLQNSLGIKEDTIELDKDNFLPFYEKHLASGRHTGIKELFEKASRMDSRLTISSTKNKGTIIRLCFLPNSG